MHAGERPEDKFLEANRGDWVGGDYKGLMAVLDAKVTYKDHLPDKPVARREQAQEAIRISSGTDASAATVADRTPAQFVVRTFFVRLMS